MSERRPDRVLGGVHDDFWRWCDEGELRLQRCGTCAELNWPPHEACEACGSAALSWEKMSGAATLASWCTFVKDYTGGALPTPWPTILVALEEGPLFIANPVGFDPGEVPAGQMLRLRFLDCEDGHGRFSLPVFEKR